MKSTELVKMAKHIFHQGIIPDSYAGQRIDQIMSNLFSEYSRSKIQEWIKNSQITIDGKTVRNKERMLGGESFTIDASLAIQIENQAEAIHLDIVFEDEHIIVVNKPIGLIVHPGAGNPSHTLLNALLHHSPLLAQLPRAGIVHRLDKHTSGLMVVAKTLHAHTVLVRSLQAREIEREYEAIVEGTFISGGTVNAPIGRHPRKRTLMAVLEGSKEAVTHYKIANRFAHHTHLNIKLETGRTHQIRVHMSHIGHPIIGDKTYGWRLHIYKHFSPELTQLLRAYSHQALHASRLALNHPLTNEYHEWRTPLPEQMTALIALLKKEDI